MGRGFCSFIILILLVSGISGSLLSNYRHHLQAEYEKTFLLKHQTMTNLENDFEASFWATVVKGSENATCSDLEPKLLEWKQAMQGLHSSIGANTSISSGEVFTDYYNHVLPQSFNPCTLLDINQEERLIIIKENKFKHSAIIANISFLKTTSIYLIPARSSHEF